MMKAVSVKSSAARAVYYNNNDTGLGVNLALCNPQQAYGASDPRAVH